MPSITEVKGDSNPAPKIEMKLTEGLGMLSVEKECLRRKIEVRNKDLSYGAAITTERAAHEDDRMHPKHLLNLAFLHLADDCKKQMRNVLDRCEVRAGELDEADTNLFNQFRTMLARDGREFESMQEYFDLLHEPQKYAKDSCTYWIEYFGFKCVLAAENMKRKEAIDSFEKCAKGTGQLLMEQWIWAGKSFEKCDIVKNTDAIVINAIRGNAEMMKEYQMCCNMRENPEQMLANVQSQCKKDGFDQFFDAFEKYSGAGMIMLVTSVAVIYTLGEMYFPEEIIGEL